MRCRTWWLWLAAAASVASCGGGTTVADDAAAGEGGDGGEYVEPPEAEDAPEAEARDRWGEAADDAPADPGGDVEAPDEGSADVPVEPDEGGAPDVPPRVVSCADDPPPGAEVAAPAPVYDGTCPTLVGGTNAITSSGAARAFILVVPADVGPAERLPLLFLWHWIGGDAAGFLEKGEVQAAADSARFLAAIPESKGDLLKWPYMIIDTEARIQEEARFFDDMLACIAAQYPVDVNCVSSIGVSAGGLWTPQLAQRRSRHLSSIVVLSGGVGQSGDVFNPVRTWATAPHKMPAVILWGGPTDFCGVNFQTTSGYLEEAFERDGHFFVECIHNCSHAEPPLDPPPGESKYAAIWGFALDHPYWLEDGESPYLVTGLPDGLPDWCGIGRGSATIRTGSCEGGILGECM